ncbi:MAG: HAD family hydrolase [Candidatus Micrarchaeaceae archaeon]
MEKTIDGIKKNEGPAGIRNILFDFGGVIASVEKRETPELDKLQWYLKRLGYTYDKARLMQMIIEGNSAYENHKKITSKDVTEAKERLNFFIKDLDVTDGQARIIMILIEDSLNIVTVRGESKAVIEELRNRGYAIGLVSNTKADNVKRLMRKSGISQHMGTQIYSHDVGYRKPGKEIFDIALKDIAARADESAYIGDQIEKDIKGAALAGFAVKILISNAQVTNPLIDHRIASLTELLRIFP